MKTSFKYAAVTAAAIMTITSGSLAAINSPVVSRQNPEIGSSPNSNIQAPHPVPGNVQILGKNSVNKKNDTQNRKYNDAKSGAIKNHSPERSKDTNSQANKNPGVN